MRQFILFAIISIGFFSCTPSSTADVDRDGQTDVFVKGDKAKDVNTSDNILIVDGLVINAITNEQWRPNSGNLAIVHEPQFSMKYNPTTKKWSKAPLKK